MFGQSSTYLQRQTPDLRRTYSPSSRWVCHKYERFFPIILYESALVFADAEDLQDLEVIPIDRGCQWL